MIDSIQIRILMADFLDSTYKPSQDEIIYEFKYAFPKGTWNRIARIIDRISLVLVAPVFVFFGGIFLIMTICSHC